MGAVADTIRYKTTWKIRKYADDQAFAEDRPFAVSEFDGNLLLNEGITAILNLLIGDAETAFSNANSSLGVGDDGATAANAAQTGLQAAVNKFYKAVEAAYPSIAGQTVTWRSIFTGAEANFDWKEFTVASGADDTADNLNRKVSDQGTKAADQTWTLDLSITFS